MRSLALFALIAAFAPRVAHAVPADCSSLPNPLYMEVGDTQLNLMKQLGRALRDNTAKPMTLVFVTNGSCTNIERFLQPDRADT